MIFNTSPGCRPQLLRGGFGLVELLVSISIMIIVTGLVLTQHSSFNSGVLLRSQAYDIGLRLREVQLSTVGAQGSGGASGYRLLFGARFNVGGNSGYTVLSTPNTNANWHLNYTTVGAAGIIDPRFQIICITRVTSTGGDLCDAGATAETYILFKRPNFDAIFFNQNGVRLPDTIIAVKILVGIPGASDGREVTITRSGQISVE